MFLDPAEPVMAKKRNDVSVRIEADLLQKARVIAAIRDVSITQYLSDVLRPSIERDFTKSIADVSRDQPPRRPK